MKCVFLFLPINRQILSSQGASGLTEDGCRARAESRRKAVVLTLLKWPRAVQWRKKK